MGKKDKKAVKQRNKRNQEAISRKSQGKRGKGRTKTSKGWDKYFTEFQTKLEPKGIHMRDVEGDGNCLFRSIADQIDGDEDQFQKYRDMAVEYIKKNKSFFAIFLPDDQNIDKYIEDMSEDGTWGGHFELVALSAVLSVKFCLHLKDEDPMMVKSTEKKKILRTVHLAYHIDEHYSSVRRIGDNEKEPAKAIDLALPDDGSSTSGDESTNSEDDLTEKMEDLALDDDKKNKKGPNKHHVKESDDEEDSNNHKKGKGKQTGKEKAENGSSSRKKPKKGRY